MLTPAALAAQQMSTEIRGVLERLARIDDLRSAVATIDATPAPT